MFSLISKHINKNHIRLYRDESLGILRNTSDPKAEILKKKFQKLFKEKDLDIIVQCNLKITNYLDITPNLNDGSYRPYKKSFEETNYIHVNSDHPSLIIKEILRSVGKRLSILLSLKNIFQESAIYYEKCLKNRGYKSKLQYQQPKENYQNKRFNPPYSNSVKNNIRRIFIKLISKHFPPNHKFG